MKKIKVNQSGMTLVEILVAMALFSIMFLMMSGIMYSSVKLNAQTRTYDQETDVQIEDVERYNPMGATIDGVTVESSNIDEYEGDNGSNQFELTFDFSSTGRVITINGYAYEAESRDDNNGFQLKFFNSTRPDIANNKYWVRVINVSTTENVKVFLYLPREEHGSFYLRNESEPYTTVVSKTIPLMTALGVGFDKTDSGNNYFWVSTFAEMDYDQLEARADEKEFKLVNLTNLLSTYDKDGDGYIDIYYTDDGFMGTDQYKTYVETGVVPS